MGSSSQLKMQLELWNNCHVAMETCILAFSGILAFCILLRHFCIFLQRVVHGAVDTLTNLLILVHA